MFLWVQKTLRQPSCRPMFVTLTYSVYMKENRDISIKIRLTEAEKEQLLQRSKEEGKFLYQRVCLERQKHIENRCANDI